MFSASRKQYGVCPTWTLLVALVKRAADVAKTHSCELSRIHQSIGFVWKKLQMGEKPEQQPARMLNPVFMWVKLIFLGESHFRALWQTASVWALSVLPYSFSSPKNTSVITTNNLCLATRTGQKTIKHIWQIWSKRSTEWETKETLAGIIAICLYLHSK